MSLALSRMSRMLSMATMSPADEDWWVWNSRMYDACSHGDHVTVIYNNILQQTVGTSMYDACSHEDHITVIYNNILQQTVGTSM